MDQLISRITAAGILIAFVAGLGVIFSAARYFTGQRAVDRVVGSMGLTWTIPMLIYALLLLVVGFVVPKLIAKYRRNSELAEFLN